MRKNLSKENLDQERVGAAIRRAKELVSDQEEPYKTAAFQVVLTQLLSDSHSSLDEFPGKNRESENESQVGAARILIPEGKLDRIISLKDPDKIPLLWSFSDKDWVGLGEFLSASEEAGIPLGQSWSHGGNFNNRLYRDKQLFVKKGEGKEAKYKLSANGKLVVKRILEGLSVSDGTRG